MAMGGSIERSDAETTGGASWLVGTSVFIIQSQARSGAEATVCSSTGVLGLCGENFL